MSLDLRTALLIGLTAASVALADEKDDLSRFEEESKRLQRELDHLQKRRERELPENEEWRRRLETLKPLAPAWSPAEEERFRRLAREAGLALDVKPVAGSERLLLQDGRPSPLELHRLEISGREPYARIQGFLLRAAHSRYFDIETLGLDAEASETVSFNARLALPSWIAGPAPAPLPRPGASKHPTPPPAASEAVRSAFARVATLSEAVETARGALDGERAWIHGTIGILERISDSRLNPTRLGEALAALARETRDPRVVLKEVRLAAEASLEGLVLGPAAPGDLQASLEKAGFQVVSIQMRPAGACQAFSVKARLKGGEPSLADPAVPEGFFAGSLPAVCGVG